MIPVTKPFMPPIEEYQSYVSSIWERNWITNNGPLVNQLELKLKEHLNVNHLLYVTNGTIALQLAIKTLGLTGEIITTPLSYVATTSSIVWEGCTPVFVDIDKETLNIDVNLIEAAITNKTTAILATHVYGNPCSIDAITAISEKYNLKVIYDAAHCFGTQYKGKSVFEFGDVSTTSFHATKLFHTAEGGAVFTTSAEILKDIAFKRNFGHDGLEDFAGIGINGKCSELHAAMGLVNLKYINSILKKRKEISEYYDEKLKGLNIQRPKLTEGINYNYAYYPVIFESEEVLISALHQLNLNLIFPRRYFYPSLSTLSYVNESHTPIANNISSKIMCLPSYHDLTKEDIDFVCRILLRVQNN